MADALCGPSNALQSFQKHTTVDRSLQQDRLAFRQPSSQGFRSSPGPGAGNVNAEFHAFQARAPLGGPHMPLHNQHTSQFAHPPQPSLPSWAADFQQLDLNSTRNSPLPASQLRHEAPLHRSSPAWHQEFLQSHEQQFSQQPLLNQGYSDIISQMPMQTFSPTMGIGGYMPSMSQQQHQLQQPTQAENSLFDEVAFAQAFDAAQEHVAEEALAKGKERAEEHAPMQMGTIDDLTFDMSHAATDFGDVTGEYDFDASSKGQVDSSETILGQLRNMRTDVGWEALDAFERAHEKEIQETNSQISRDVVETIRTMRAEEGAGLHEYLSPWEDSAKIGADTIPANEAHESLSPNAEADELSRTAGQLIDNLKNEQSKKFQESNFMELMRQLRDKEVRVEGDKMISFLQAIRVSRKVADQAKTAQAPHPGGKYYPYDAFNGAVDQVTHEQPREPEQVGA